MNDMRKLMEAIENVGEDEYSEQGIKFRDSNEYIFTIASRLRKLKKFAQAEYEQASEDMNAGHLDGEDAVASLGLVVDDIVKLVDLIENSSVRNQGGTVYPPRAM